MRKTLALAAVGITFLAAYSGAQPTAAPATQPYGVVQKAKVGGAGGWDYCLADADGRRLYIPRGNRTTVFDLDTLASVGVVADTNASHGVAVDPKTHHGFVSSNPIVMFDTQTLATIKTIDVQGSSPDGILFEPFTERVYVLSHRVPNVVVLDATNGSVVGTINLDGQPEQGQSDGAGHVYIDVEDKNNVAAVDATTMKVTAHYDLAGKGGGPGGLGLDAKNHILFVMCHTPATCVIMDATNGTILDTLPIHAGVDAAEFNPNTLEAFSSQGDGTLTVIKENSPTSFAVEQTVTTMQGARTSTLDSKTNRILLVTTEYLAPTTAPAAAGASGGAAPGGAPAGGAPAGRGGGRGGRGGGRGTPAPDGFTIVVVGR
jgi:DNA-binding beta-propeller fold protein YncE